MKNLSFAGGIALFTLALAACGDDTGDGTGSGGGSTSSSTTAASTTTSGSSGATTASSTSSTSSGDGGAGTGGDTGTGGAPGTGGDSPAGTGGAGTGGDSGTGGSSAAVQEIDCGDADIGVEIGTQGFAYDPETATIDVGQAIRFTPGSAIHNIQAVDESWESGFGDTVCFQFDVAGTYDFECGNHGPSFGGDMAGTLTVE